LLEAALVSALPQKKLSRKAMIKAFGLLAGVPLAGHRTNTGSRVERIHYAGVPFLEYAVPVATGNTLGSSEKGRHSNARRRGRTGVRGGSGIIVVAGRNVR
jgi:hypothetical protein